MVSDVRGEAVSMNVHHPLEAAEVCMAGAHVLRLEVLQLTIDVETVLKSRHCEATIKNDLLKSNNGLQTIIPLDDELDHVN